MTLNPSVQPSEKRTVVVLDFEGNVEGEKGGMPTGYWSTRSKAGILVADALTTALLKVEQYRLIERQRLKRLLQELNMSPADLVSPENLRRFRKLANVDAVVLGSVSSYGYWQNRVGQEGAWVEFNARMIDSYSGEVLWSASVVREIKGNVVTGEVLNMACAELVEELQRRMRR